MARPLNRGQSEPGANCIELERPGTLPPFILAYDRMKPNFDPQMRVFLNISYTAAFVFMSKRTETSKMMASNFLPNVAFQVF